MRPVLPVQIAAQWQTVTRNLNEGARKNRRQSCPDAGNVSDSHLLPSHRNPLQMTLVQLFDARFAQSGGIEREFLLSFKPLACPIVAMPCVQNSWTKTNGMAMPALMKKMGESERKRVASPTEAHENYVTARGRQRTADLTCDFLDRRVRGSKTPCSDPCFQT